MLFLAFSEVDPLVFHMRTEDPGNVAYSSVGGLGEQIRELREVFFFSLFGVNTDR